MGTISKITDSSGVTHSIASSCYGTCSTAAATADKVATLTSDSGFQLETGVTVFIKFTYTNSASGARLNVNRTGSIAIKRNGTTNVGRSIEQSWPANTVVPFTYDGTYWQMCCRESSNGTSSSTYAHSEGGSTASGSYSHAEGSSTASGSYSHAEGYYTTASGNYSHAEGGGYNTSKRNIAAGANSHAEGYMTIAQGSGAHAEGCGVAPYSGHTTYDFNMASGIGSHAEGRATIASAASSHAEGYYATASGDYSHAEGYYTTAYGIGSHAEGFHTIAQRQSQHVFGEYNVADTTGASGTVRGSYVEIVGNGSDENTRSNARTLDWSGNEVLAGGLECASILANEISTGSENPGIVKSNAYSVLYQDAGGTAHEDSILEISNNGLITLGDTLKTSIVQLMYPLNSVIELQWGRDPNTLFPGTTWVLSGYSDPINLFKQQPVTFDYGSFNSDGSDSNSSTDLGNRVRTENFMFLIAGTYTITTTFATYTDTNYRIQHVLYAYDHTRTIDNNNSQKSWQNGPFTFTLSDDRYVRFGFRYANNASIAIRSIGYPKLVLGSSIPDIMGNGSITQSHMMWRRTA